MKLPVFYLTYISHELRRRWGRSLVTVLGLGLGVGLVVTVTALSRGLDRAQEQVLNPLGGVGTDLVVSRPVTSGTEEGSGSFRIGGRGGLSAKELQQLRRENRDLRINPSEIGEPGERFSRDSFVVATDLSFPDARIEEIAGLRAVDAASGALSLGVVRSSGTVPKQSVVQRFRRGQGLNRGDIDIELEQLTVGGVDVGRSDLGLITEAQVERGRYFAKDRPRAREAIVAEGYARRKGLSIGSTVKLKDSKFRVVGLAEPPLGGETADVFVPLARLQRLSDREGRVNRLLVRATDAADVAVVEREIEAAFKGAKASTSGDLAENISGSLADAADLSNRLTLALAAVVMLAAVAIASLLMLSGVSKRTRELGTLKALGWRSRLVVRQITGEALAYGALGGVIGAGLGVAAASIFTALSPTLEATAAGPNAVPSGPAAFGLGRVPDITTETALEAPVDVGLVGLAIVLALAGGMIAGAAGAWRASRFRPADALRQIE